MLCLHLERSRFAVGAPAEKWLLAARWSSPSLRPRNERLLSSAELAAALTRRVVLGIVRVHDAVHRDKIFCSASAAGACSKEAAPVVVCEVPSPPASGKRERLITLLSRSPQAMLHAYFFSLCRACSILLTSRSNGLPC